MGLIPQIPGLDGLAALGELPSLLQDLPNFLQSYEKAMLGLAQITEFVISSMENSKVLISVIQSYMEQLRCAVSSLNQSGFVDRIRDAISYVREAIDNIRNTIFKMYQSSFVGLVRAHPVLAAFLVLVLLTFSVSFLLLFFACVSLSAVAMVPVFSIFLVVLATLMPMAICGIGAVGCSLWSCKLLYCKYKSLKLKKS